MLAFDAHPHPLALSAHKTVKKRRVVVATAMPVPGVGGFTARLIIRGAGGRVMTTGRDVRRPASTVLKFRLDRAVALHEKR